MAHLGHVVAPILIGVDEASRLSQLREVTNQAHKISETLSNKRISSLILAWVELEVEATSAMSWNQLLSRFHRFIHGCIAKDLEKDMQKKNDQLVYCGLY